VIPVLVDSADLTDAIGLARELARRLDLAETGDFVLMVRGFHADPRVSAPSITLITV
jgi:hypothetical protein